jgi:site-specific DNA recombinase
MVHELSRLSRSVYHTLDIFDTLGKTGIGFPSVRDPDFDFADPSKRLFLTIIAAINEYFIVALSQHTRKSKRERSRQGLYNATSMPFGYDHEGDARTPATVNPQETEIVRFAFENYATGRFSDVDITELLNAQGYHTRSGRRFSKDTVSGMLSHPFYMGKVPYRDASTGVTEIFEGRHEAIVSEDLWEKVQDVRTSRRTLSRAVQKKYQVYLLSNLAVCDACGRTLRGQGSKSGLYYREMSFQRGYADCPHQGIGVRANLLDGQIHALIKNIELPKDWLEEVVGQVEDDAQLINLRRQRDRLEAERHRLQQMRIEGDFDDNLETYRDEMDRIRRENASLPTYDQIETIRVTGKAIEGLYQLWETADDADQRDLLRLMLREVRVDVCNGRITSIAPLALFLSIFRKIPMLAEQEYGEFVPLWDIQETGNIPSLQQLPVEATASVNPSVTLPFFQSKFLAPAGDLRNSPNIAESLRMFSEKTKHPAENVVQIVFPGELPLPMDLRRWPAAHCEHLSLTDFLQKPASDVDVLVSQYLLWENVSRRNELAEDVLAQVHERLCTGGVWYFKELLPQDFQAHWLYRYLPASWQWAKMKTWKLHTFYNQLLSAGFSVTSKRHAFRQPVAVSAAREILTRYPGFASTLTDGVMQHALERLGQIENQAELLLSEFTVIEGWAQKK